MLKNLEEILIFISQDNFISEKEVVGKIKENLDFLREYPNIGRTGLVENIKELVISHFPYLVVYRINEKKNSIDILRVFQDAQKKLKNAKNPPRRHFRHCVL